MRYGLSNEQKFELLRPLDPHFQRDSHDIPIMDKVTEDMIDFRGIRALNIQNLNIKNNNSDCFIFMFSDDNDLQRLWNHPLRYIPLLQTAYAIATPDFSIDPKMEREELRHMVFQNRWLGCTSQTCGILTLPTMVWADKSTYDICFDNIQHGSIVVVSTIGCAQSAFFLPGYREMLRRIEPALIVVYGRILPGMYGRFVNFKYKDGFVTKKSPYVQTALPLECSPIFEIKEVC